MEEFKKRKHAEYKFRESGEISAFSIAFNFLLIIFLG